MSTPTPPPAEPQRPDLPTKTELRAGKASVRLLKPVARMSPLSPEELHMLGHSRDGVPPVGLHDSKDPLLD